MKNRLAALAMPALRLLPPETAHGLTMKALKLGFGPSDRVADDPVLEARAFGRTFPNPIGLAAGFDKNAEVPDAMLMAGFGFVECGTVTPFPQPGNPRPRIFRLKEDRAVINRLGFNSAGREVVKKTLESRKRPGGIVGVNVGANKFSDDKIDDYALGIAALGPFASYIAMNVSSPNTPGLRDLHEKESLARLLDVAVATRANLRNPVPLLLKIAPDLADEAIAKIVETAIAKGIEGIIVSNTTVSRPNLKSPQAKEEGGLSGAPLFEFSTAKLRVAARAARGRLALIGVGGISSARDVYAKIRAGASVVQLYTALIYEGPSLILRIKRELAALLKADGFASVKDAVGADLKT